MSEEEQAGEAVEEVFVEAKAAGSLFIGLVDQRTRKEFAKFAKDSKRTSLQLFIALFNNYKSLGFEFDDTETALMQEAHLLAPNTFAKRIKRAAVRYAQHIIALKDKPEAEIDLQIKNSSKAADRRADTLIEQMLKNNEEAANWYDKILLTKSSISDYASKLKTQDPTNNIAIGKVVLDRALERYKARIDKHHAEHKLADNHNVAAYYERLKADKGEPL